MNGGEKRLSLCVWRGEKGGKGEGGYDMTCLCWSVLPVGPTRVPGLCFDL